MNVNKHNHIKKKRKKTMETYKTIEKYEKCMIRDTKQKRIKNKKITYNNCY